ncbi:MAG: 2-octaprenyl-6-methoxyphenyl hydroxylase [Pseudomonadales bacterium]|nr:2-octaprenyl-6-methoxyphenyl hydroxylase [Pseudomonadales bacterium]
MLIESPRNEYDVLVVGGGMVGASFALDLARRSANSSISICVIEAVALGDQTNQPSFDARSTALAWSSRAIYEAMGVWKQLAAVVTPIEEIQVSDHGHFGVTRLHHSEQGVEALGYVVENRELGTVLNAALTASPVIELLAPATIQSATPRTEGMDVEIELADQRKKINAKLVVLADGGRSPLCAQLGIDHSRENYEQSALITNIGVEIDHGNVAYERFTESGPLAVLPLQEFEGQARCSLVWTVKSGNEQSLVDCSEEEFIQQLESLYGNRLGFILKVGQRFSYPLSLTEAKEQIRPGLVLLGNVAHTLHPVAGQGLNLALRDSACLSETIANAAEAGRSPGSMAVLQSYLDQQTPDQHQTMLFTDQMTKLFSSAQLSKVITRKMGLLSLDLVPTLRQEFARRAMGT